MDGHSSSQTILFICNRSLFGYETPIRLTYTYSRIV